MLYHINDNILHQIHVEKFSSEKELQTLCETNLQTLLNLEFVATEFSVENFRIDTLAYDENSNSFIIIEYKNKEIDSVVDQGIAYLSTMLNNKAHFVLKFSQFKNKVYDIKNINWEQSKVIFISPKFTQYQLGAVNFQGMPIELWEIKKFSNGNIYFEQIGNSTRRGNTTSVTANIKEIFAKNTQYGENPIDEIKTYSEDEHINYSNNEIQDIYIALRDFILSESEGITVKATKIYIGFYKSRSPIISIRFNRKSLTLWINERFSNINDPQGIIKDMSSTGHHGIGDCEIKISDDSNIGYIQDILRKHILNKG